MAWNEGHYAMIALNFDRYGLWSQRNELGVDHTFSPGVPWLIWASFKLFGPTEWAARLPIALSGIAAIVLVAALVRRLLHSEQIALIAAAFVSAAPGLIYYSQNVQLDTPSICSALAGAVLMLRYRQDGRRLALVGSGIFLAVAIWFKFTAVLFYPTYLILWRGDRSSVEGSSQPVARDLRGTAAFVMLTALPSAVWIAANWLTREASGEFYHRLWDLRGVGKALAEIPLALEAHLFIPIFILMVAGIPLALRWRSRLLAVWAWCLPWILPYVLAPWDSLVNRYYDLPAAYLLVVPAALAMWSTWARNTSGISMIRRVGIVLAVVLAVTVAYDVWDPMTDRIARATMAHVPPIDPAPFYSAKIVARLPHGRTVVDTPQTMFYAGGDPAWITITGGGVVWKIDGETFDYVVLNDYGHGQEPYYPLDDALRRQLARHRYVQIAPGAWAHMRTRIADLGGYLDPDTPYWSPWPGHRLPGMDGSPK